MSGEKHIDSSGLVTPGSLPDSSVKLLDKNMGENKVQTSSAFPLDAQPRSLDLQGVYYYPGQSDSLGQSSFNVAGGSYMFLCDNQSNNTSLPYYPPGYGPYTTCYYDIDGEPTYPLSEYPQQQTPPCTYGSEAFSCYSYDSAFSGNASAAYSGQMKPVMMGPGNSNGYNGAEVSTNLSNKPLSVPYNERVQRASSFSKVGSGFQSTNRVRGYNQGPKFSLFNNRNRGGFMQHAPTNYQSNSRTWNSNNYRYRSRESFGQNAENEALTELTRGPRFETKNSSPKTAEEDEQAWLLAVRRDSYNVQDFKTEYDDAKFFVVKSYSEDDVHKSIKYNVWSSTLNGNKKLDAAFREADAKANQAGQKCPLFLFYSVNGSGQFVGVAEMIGPVDFTKDMDFWQLSKWNGFFPIKWHIIKDVPNRNLKHITLENNENRAVTHSRDTQEIRLKQGLEMLSIFKNYSERTSILDDFHFYEKREKTLKARNKKNPRANGFKSSDYEYEMYREGQAREKYGADITVSSSTIESFTNKLSLDS